MPPIARPPKKLIIGIPAGRSCLCVAFRVCSPRLSAYLIHTFCLHSIRLTFFFFSFIEFAFLFIHLFIFYLLFFFFFFNYNSHVAVFFGGDEQTSTICVRPTDLETSMNSEIR